MVYIYKKLIGTKPYYYLRLSERKGKRVIVKDIAYLGSSIEEVKKELQHLPQYKEKIRKAYKLMHHFIETNRYLEKALSLKLKKDIFMDKKLAEVEACKLHYLGIFQKYDQLTKNEILKNFIIEFSFNTASIEGNTIGLQEAKNLLEDGIAPKNKTLREIYDIQNNEKAFMQLFKLKEEINHELIIKIHSMLMENIDKRTGYRTTEVRVIKSNFEATPAPYIKADINLLLSWYNANKNKLHSLALAAIFHHKFEKIHPFMDGNGRTGRMLLNFILMINNYPPLIIHKKNRIEYLDSLREADKSNPVENKKENYFKLAQYISDEMICSYWNIFL